MSFIPSASAAEPVALISRMEGKVLIKHGGKMPMEVTASAGDKLSVGDEVITEKKAKAEINFSDNSTVRMAEESRVSIDEYLEGDKAVMKMPRGKVQALVPPRLTGKLGGVSKGNRFEIRTPGAVAGVRGTDFFVVLQEGKAEIIVKEGTVAAYNPKFVDAVVLVKMKMMTSISQDQRPLAPRSAPAAVINSFEKAVTPPGEPILWEKSSFNEHQDGSKTRDSIQINPPSQNINQPNKNQKKYDLKDKGYRIKASL